MLKVLFCEQKLSYKRCVIVFALKTVSKHRVEYFVNGRVGVYDSFYDLLNVRIARKINCLMASVGLVVLFFSNEDFIHGTRDYVFTRLSKKECSVYRV